MADIPELQKELDPQLAPEVHPDDDGRQRRHDVRRQRRDHIPGRPRGSEAGTRASSKLRSGAVVSAAVSSRRPRLPTFLSTRFSFGFFLYCGPETVAPAQYHTTLEGGQ